MKYFFKIFLRENFWKTNLKAHTGPFNSILTVFVVIYVMVQWTYCSKRTTSMNDLTTLEYWWIGVSRRILFNDYYDVRWYEISLTILSYGPVLS